jgi:hypothetical protein
LQLGGALHPFPRLSGCRGICTWQCDLLWPKECGGKEEHAMYSQRIRRPQEFLLVCLSLSHIRKTVVPPVAASSTWVPEWRQRSPTHL